MKVRSLSLALALVATVFATATASARTAAVPQNTAPPTITGNEREGETLTASNGTWSNSPTKFAYQWQRCSSNGTSCTDISGATNKTYTVASADADQTIRVTVTASNADGQSSSSSKTTDVVSSKGGPVNTVKPTISGTVQVGEELTASNGTWTGGVKTYAYQWQRCTSTGCTDVSGASGRTYGVRSADVGNALRIVVTATNGAGSTDTSSALTSIVKSATGSTTVITQHGNKAPTISFLSLRHAGARVYAQFRVCDDSQKSVTVVQRDAKPSVLGYTRRFAVTPINCATANRTWVPASRFRTHAGPLTVSLRAVDKSGASSRMVSRKLAFYNSGV